MKKAWIPEPEKAINNPKMAGLRAKKVFTCATFVKHY
jgi:hypothetical protein